MSEYIPMRSAEVDECDIEHCKNGQTCKDHNEAVLRVNNEFPVANTKYGVEVAECRIESEEKIENNVESKYSLHDRWNDGMDYVLEEVQNA